MNSQFDAVPSEILMSLCQEMVRGEETGSSSVTNFSRTSSRHRETAMEAVRMEVGKKLNEQDLGISYLLDSRKIVIQGLTSRSILKGNVSIDIHEGRMSTEVQITVQDGSRSLRYIWCENNTRDDDWEAVLYGVRVTVECWRKYECQVTLEDETVIEPECRMEKLRIEGMKIQFPVFIESEKVRVANEELAIIRKAIEGF